MDRHAAIGRTPLRSRVHAGIDPPIAPHCPETRCIGLYGRVAPPRGGVPLHPAVVAVDLALIPACAVGHEQQPELRTGGQPPGEQAPVAGHRGLGGMGPPPPVRRPLADDGGAGRAHLHLIGRVHHQARDARARAGAGHVLRTVGEAPAVALAVLHIVADDCGIPRRLPAHIEARRAPPCRRHRGPRQGAAHDDGVEPDGGAVRSGDRHLDRVVAPTERHLEAVRPGVGIDERGPALVLDLDGRGGVVRRRDDGDFVDGVRDRRRVGCRDRGKRRGQRDPGAGVVLQPQIAQRRGGGGDARHLEDRGKGEEAVRGGCSRAQRGSHSNPTNTKPGQHRW